ncbi:MAG: M48 family metallopeptidase [Thermodesulfobacteriota bacterium]|nr:M48 family metallopeptidase [Thermodesulfobacteriota bacterium]
MKRKISFITPFIILTLMLFGFILIPEISDANFMDKLKKVGSNLEKDLKKESGKLKKNTKTGLEIGKKGVEKVKGTFADFTPEQEYYIGRAVGASVLENYKPYKNKEVSRYINLLGLTLSQASDMPETFGGYHFMVLDSDHINAFAAPGGLIFVARGLLRCCKNEDAVAAVLAHEIGHVQHKHGLQAIKKSRVTSTLTLLAAIGAAALADQQMSELSAHFGGSISDINDTLNKGYSRSFEREADRAAVTILKKVGYDPAALVDMLEVMDQDMKPGGFGFAKNHPSPKSRIKYVKGRIPPGEASESKPRQTRFQKALGSI